MPIYSSLGTVLKQTIAAVLTTIVGIRDVDFDTPELETYEIDDLSSSNVDEDPSGRSKGGSVKFSFFYDPASASNVAMIALFNSQVKTAGVYVPTAFSIEWSANPTSTQLFSGTLVKQTRKAERGSPLMGDGEIKITRRPALV